jgi:hypothetical protein
MNASIQAELNLTVPELDLSTIVDRDDKGTPITLADKICTLVVAELAAEGWSRLRARVQQITDEEIHRQVTTVVTEAIAAGVRRTNAFGEPVGEVKTLRQLILEEAHAPNTNPYASDRSTLVERIVREEVKFALHEELPLIVQQEREKIVTAIRESAAEFITRAFVGDASGARISSPGPVVSTEGPVLSTG